MFCQIGVPGHSVVARGLKKRGSGCVFVVGAGYVVGSLVLARRGIGARSRCDCFVEVARWVSANVSVEGRTDPRFVVVEGCRAIRHGGG